MNRRNDGDVSFFGVWGTYILGSSIVIILMHYLFVGITAVIHGILSIFFKSESKFIRDWYKFICNIYNKLFGSRGQTDTVKVVLYSKEMFENIHIVLKLLSKLN